jgi:sporulation protein YlmC with PRC-barrel domain
MNIVVAEPTKQTFDLKLAEDDKGRLLIPFSAVKSVGDFIIIAEKDIV